MSQLRTPFLCRYHFHFLVAGGSFLSLLGITAASLSPPVDSFPAQEPWYPSGRLLIFVSNAHEACLYCYVLSASESTHLTCPNSSSQPCLNLLYLFGPPLMDSRSTSPQPRSPFLARPYLHVCHSLSVLQGALRSPQFMIMTIKLSFKLRICLRI